MNSIRRVAALAALALAGCGGGGGGGGDPPHLNFQFTPATLAGTVYSGDTEAFQFDVVVSGNASGGTVYVSFVDPQHILLGAPSISQDSPTEYTMTLSLSTSLAPGEHDGAFEIRVCGDLSCSMRYQTTPATFPYDVTVLSSTNLTPLAALNGAAPWRTFQGDHKHQGHVPVTLDPAQFSPRWRRQLPGQLSHPVAADGRVYVSANGTGYDTGKDIFALVDSNGVTQWNRTIAWTIYEQVSHPGLLDDKLFAIASSSPNGYMLKLNAQTGAEETRDWFNDQWWEFNAPVGYNGKVYWAGAYTTGLNQLDVATGQVDWSNGSSISGWRLAPAVDDNFVYGYGCLSCALERLNAAGNHQTPVVDTGELSNPVYLPEWYAPVLSGTSAYVTGPGHVSKLNLTDNDTTWSSTGNYVTNPTVTPDVVYAATGAPLQVEARAVVDGELLWTWTPPEDDETEFVGQLIATNNLLFVSTNRRIRALSLTTHEPVWTYLRPGFMALSSSGLLYVTRTDADGLSDGTLVAINLH